MQATANEVTSVSMNHSQASRRLPIHAQLDQLFCKAVLTLELTDWCLQWNGGTSHGARKPLCLRCAEALASR